MEEQKRSNEDIERTMEQIRQLIVARGEQRSTPRTKSVSAKAYIMLHLSKIDESDYLASLIGMRNILY